MQKYYRISGVDLLDLLYTRAELRALECGGVDNWPHYGEVLQQAFDKTDEELIEEFFNNIEENNGKVLSD